MNIYTPKTKQELYLFKHFSSKSEIAKALKVTRPTVDKICSEPTYFIKYASQISKATKQPFTKVLKALNNGL
jgi:DNA invertase Pin-like site-specific DNA recombinase|tara:strand:+ start:9531 stop:9746 length:216 start_codon:yes stop_codon:yes gene_type:complete